MSENKLYGKRISFNGDSICQGAGHPGGYGKIIAERNDMIYQNVGIGGGTITVGVHSKAGVLRHSVCATIEKMDPEADYAIVEGGVNDASIAGDPNDWDIKLGEISSGYNAELDESTFYGAFESMLKQLTAKYSARGQKVGYIAVHKMTWRFASDCEEKESFYHAAKKCCAKWGVPFCDLNTTVPPFAFFRPDGDPELYAVRLANTKDGDGWHPNEAGYLNYYCDKIEAWLKAL